MYKISILGNCQAYPIQVLLKETIGDVVFSPIPPIYTILGNDSEINRIHNELHSSDAIISQPLIHDGFQKLTLNHLKEEFSTRLIVVPVIYYQGDYPELFYLKDSNKAPLRDFISHYFDWNVLISYLQGNSETFTADLIHCKDFYSQELQNKLHHFSINELKKKEQHCDIIISDFIEEHAINDDGLFWTMNHPKNTVIYKLVERILEKMGYSDMTLKKREKEFLARGQVPKYNGRSPQDMCYSGGGWSLSRHEMVTSYYNYFKTVGNELLEFNLALARQNPVMSYFLDEISERIHLLSNQSIDIQNTLPYCIGYDERQQNIVYKHKTEPYNVINIAYLMSLDPSHAQDFLISTLKDIANTHEHVNLSHLFLHTDLRSALLREKHFSYEEHQNVLDFLVRYIKFFLKYDRIDIFEPSSDHKKICYDSKWPPGLFVRYGNVELRVLENWIFHHDTLIEIEKSIRRNLASDEYMYSKPTTRNNWLSSSDIAFNLRSLMTNAGYYPSLEDDNSLETWCRSYYDALKHATALFPYQGSYPFFFSIQEQLYSENKFMHYVPFPNIHSFYHMLAGENVLFITPFAEQINALYASGQLYHLYTDITIPQFDLLALPSFLSTYPNRPHQSWRATFELLKQQIDDVFEKKTPTLFFVSAGCYGLPLADYVYTTYGITSVHYGNFINTLFGISQQCSENFMSQRRIDKNWAKSHLGNVANVNRIDGGRYV